MKEYGSEDSVRHGMVHHHETLWSSKSATRSFLSNHFLEQVVSGEVALRFLSLQEFLHLDNCSNQSWPLFSRECRILENKQAIRRKAFAHRGRAAQ